jgi:predicted lipoprotein with Yx(FWY)xxD motif
MHSILRPLFLILASLALIAACTSNSGASVAPSAATPSAAPSEAAPSEAAPSEAAPSEAAGSATISLSTTPLGDIIVEDEGKTVYAFTPDTEGVSTCYDDCETNWPPLIAEDGETLTAGEGLDAAKLTTVDRTDGTKQVKYGDWPLYYFAGDSAAGDTNGQGVGDKWFVVDASGALIGQ